MKRAKKHCFLTVFWRLFNFKQIWAHQNSNLIFSIEFLISRHPRDLWVCGFIISGKDWTPLGHCDIDHMSSVWSWTKSPYKCLPRIWIFISSIYLFLGSFQMRLFAIAHSTLCFCTIFYFSESYCDLKLTEHHLPLLHISAIDYAGE